MIEIDGSYGEGGGQVVRTAVALSAVTGKEIKVTNIRRNRPNPGLKQQHLKALETAARICEARVSGLFPGSSELFFAPVEIKGGKYEIDIGTAGSITLFLQSLMPALPFAKEKIEITIRGGTDVAWSPTIDYLQHVTFRALEQLGYAGSVTLKNRGYYPRGGGEVSAVFEPCKLRGFHFRKEGENKRAGKNRIEEENQKGGENQNQRKEVMGISHASNLPAHVPSRQAEAAESMLLEVGYGSRIKVRSCELLSTGSGITLWSGYCGGSALGERGLPAEKVGRRAAEELISELRTEASVDVHLADQLIPYMALAGNSSYTVRELTLHAATNIWVTEQFLDVKFRIEEKEGLFEVSVD
ncbi:ribosomal subunit interface protein [Methanosarcina sp. 2.H.T.1A.6]|uniref:RNA 3'-terminal phosphate cyclase n=1 Tax=unclassified Methanosarcina TaxID=2644672 RepID=UPI000621FA46|nr:MULTISPECIES: RNA 3'-terminal phosphate cyclase [unclassified Methanosarcina]KKG12190.1 ribosomal subunit interface protein [Methanosarcina sp. 2.H.T.1A.15]KKG16610.1 ribosomal subunit interface protein [Methanosarcina sp. 2.H.T.1A.3]KKG25185.1 ribosomal subunit interface protein [Methanosarcina sp. 2.H.T.1A.6]KKG26513.1 ribosomal subunit interface protein [Methanosarcina sp. 2.H.T.1A.8]